MFADPIKDIKDATIVEAFQKVFETLENCGLKPTLNITNNQAVKPINRIQGMGAYLRPSKNKPPCELAILRDIAN